MVLAHDQDSPVVLDFNAGIDPNDPYHSSVPVAASDFITGNGPIDLALYQTPRQALINLRFAINCLLGGAVGWLLNWVCALIITKGKTRAVLWHSVSDYNDPIEGDFIKMYGGPIYIDWFLSGLLTAFIGGIIGHFTLRFEVRAAKKRPIHPTYTEHWIFTIIGTHNSYVLVRSLIYMCWGMLVSYPICLILFAIACGAGGMDTMMLPYDFTDKACYLSRNWFCFIKGFYCVAVTSLIAPLIELGGLNLPNLSNNTLKKYVEKKKHDDNSLSDSAPGGTISTRRWSTSAGSGESRSGTSLPTTPTTEMSKPR